MNNTWLVGVVALVVGVLIGWGFGASNSSRTLSMGTQTSQIAKGEEFKLAMRKLWEDHIVWTRMWIISEAYNTGEADADAARLLKNQEDIGNAIKPYYGDEAGDQLTTLLKTHITTAVDLVRAAKAGDADAMNAANDTWYANGNELADFLAAANPNWPQTDLRMMMKDHLDLTKQEAVDILQFNYEASISDYDKVHDEILMMADALSDGIIKQFPEKF